MLAENGLEGFEALEILVNAEVGLAYFAFVIVCYWF